jgi:hypothetical protein
MRLAINSRKKSRPANYWLHAVTGTIWQKLSTLQINSRWVWQTVCGEGCTLLTAGGTVGGAAGGRINVGPIGEHRCDGACIIVGASQDASDSSDHAQAENETASFYRHLLWWRMHRLQWIR